MKKPTSESGASNEQQVGTASQGTRREHLANLAKAGGLVLAGIGAEQKAEAHDAEELKKKRLEYDPNFSAFSYQIRVKFKSDFIPINSKMTRFIEDFIHSNNQVLEAIGMGKSSAKETTRGISFIPGIELQRALLRQWEILKVVLSLKEEFSPQNLNYALAYLLPQYLADFGIIVKPQSILQRDTLKGIVLNTHLTVGFSKVKSMTKDVNVVRGKRVENDVITSEPLSEYPQQKFYGSIGFAYGGEHFLGNILIHDSAMQQIPSKISQLKKNAEVFRSLQLNDKISKMEKSNDPRVEATFHAIYEITNKIPLDEMIKKEIGRTRIHEAGHVYFENNFVNRFPPPKSNRLSDLNIFGANLGTHSEICAMLTEMQDESYRGASLLKVLQYLNHPENYDFIHPQAADWIIRRLINLLKSDPEKYGIVVDPDLKVSVDNQILVQIPKLLDNPRLFGELLTLVTDIHERNLKQDFSANYYRYMKLPVPMDLPNTPLVEPEYELPKRFRWKEVGIGMGVAAGLTAGGIALRRHQKRKELVRLEERLPKILKGTGGKKYDTRSVIKDLQFGVSEKEADLPSRQKAIQELRRLKLNDIADYLEKVFGLGKKEKADGQK